MEVYEGRFSMAALPRSLLILLQSCPQSCGSNPLFIWISTNLDHLEQFENGFYFWYRRSNLLWPYYGIMMPSACCSSNAQVHTSFYRLFSVVDVFYRAWSESSHIFFSPIKEKPLICIYWAVQNLKMTILEEFGCSKEVLTLK